MATRIHASAIAAATVACGLASLFAQPAPRPERSDACRVERTTYHGWAAVRLSNAWVTLIMVPNSGGYSWERLTDGATCAVRLAGPDDPFTGQQYIRDIGIDADSPVISFHAVMKNVGGYPQTWSEQSVTQYATADPKNRGRANPNFWGFTPANAQSVFPGGYHVRTGSASSSGYVVRDGLFVVHSSEAAGEVWVDSPGEWLAVVDGSTQYAMVERFRYRRGEEYPGGATVIFYTTAPPQPPRTPLFYMEAEINSPLVRLDPGESYALDTQWFPTRMGRDLKAVTYAGAIGQPFVATTTPGGLTLEGTFGVFFAGRLEARFYYRRGLSVGTTDLDAVSPLDIVTLQRTIKAPADATRVSLHVIDRQGTDRGPLGEAGF